jgi:glutaminyl-peptide cyclotransferase
VNGSGQRFGVRQALWIAAVALTGVTALLILARPAFEAGAANDALVWYDYRVVNVFPHDPQAFTQGLLYRDGYLYESTGLYGRSDLRRVRLETGEVLARRPIDPRYFAEGLADFGNRLIQLTWQENTGFIYELETFALIGTFSYPGEGWGLTSDGERLIMSDGTAELRFLDPDTLAETSRVTVMQAGVPVDNLNELELIDGSVYANIWQSDEIVIIDPATGRVTGRIDMQGLLPPEVRARVDVLNGIAWDEQGDRLFVTGKLWPSLFEIRLQPR